MEVILVWMSGLGFQNPPYSYRCLKIGPIHIYRCRRIQPIHTLTSINVDLFIYITLRVSIPIQIFSNISDFYAPQRSFGRHIVIALSVRPSRFRVRSISPIFFEVGIPNLVCGYILGWRSVAYHFRVTVTLTLTSDLVFRIIVSGAYLLYYLR